MTYSSKQQKKPLTESDALSRKLLLREGILDIILGGAKKLSRMYHGSDEPFDTVVAAARGSRRTNYERWQKSRRDYEYELQKVRKEFLARQSSLHPLHPERLENQFRAETGNPHVHTPAVYVRRAFDPAAAYADIIADPTTSGLPAHVQRTIMRTRQSAHNETENANQEAHVQRERALQQARDQEFKDFADRKLQQHARNITTGDYNHPLTAAKRVFDRDKKLYDLAYKSGGRLEKYRRMGDAARGALSYYVSSSDSPAARLANIIGHQLRTGGKQQELSPPGVSEPFGSGDSEHGPR